MIGIRTKVMLLFPGILLLCLSVLPLTSFAAAPYNTFYKDSFGKLVWTQSAYYPVSMIGKDLSIPDPNNPANLVPSPLKQPKDIYIDSKDDIYIADTGNNRIVHLNAKGSLVRIIDVPESKLSKPEGVFVTDDGEIYIADTGNKRLIKLDREAKLVQEYNRPESKFIPETFKYEPIKVVVDNRGFLFIATLGGYQGLLQLDPDGAFINFFGANKAPFTALDAIKRQLYTKEMYAREISKLPGSVNNVAIDQSGFIYTVTSGTDISTQQIKKLNIAGKDLLTSKDSFSGGGERSFGETLRRSETAIPQPNDAAVDSEGNITVIDAGLKYINQYDSSGNLLFFWSGNPDPAVTQLGIIKNPVSVESNSKDELYVLDDQANMIQVFRLSEFGQLVHKANKLTLEGKYEESEEDWQEVLRLNAHYTPALSGLAKAAYKKGDFERAKGLFKQAGNQHGYSDSYWQIRLNWFQQRFAMLMNIGGALIIVAIMAEKATRNMKARVRWRERRRSRGRWADQFQHVWYLLKHPWTDLRLFGTKAREAW